jgi:hypothetical protein
MRDIGALQPNSGSGPLMSGVQVARQPIQVGFPARMTVTIELDDTSLRIIDDQDDLITIMPRDSTW